MKKRLLAILVTTAMLVCMLPAMAFADEAPAQEQNNEAVLTEETAPTEEVVEETTEEEVKEEAPAVEEEAQKEELKEETGDLEGKYETSYTMLVPVMVKLTNPADKDTDFTFSVVKLILGVVDVEYGQNKTIEREFSLVNASYFNFDKFEVKHNIITVKAGEDVARAIILVGMEKRGEPSIASEHAEGPLGVIVQATSNTGGYTNPSTCWAALDEQMLRYFLQIGNENVAASKVATFKNMAAVKKFIKTMNKSDLDEAMPILNATFDKGYVAYTPAKAKASAGVKTGDSNEMAVWMVVFAISCAVTAAYVLKRREN